MYPPSASSDQRSAEGPSIEGNMGELGNILGFHIRLAHGAVYRHFSEAFTALGLTQKQVSTLWLVADQPGIAQVELGAVLRMDRATTMSIVNRLQERGFVRRERSDTDGRKQSLHVTEAGLQALEDAKPCILEHEAWLTSRFTPEEVKILVEMLARIHE